MVGFGSADRNCFWFAEEDVFARDNAGLRQPERAQLWRADSGRLH